ncbi:transcriptional regulator [Ensifer aridi]|uniref:transcriptional regulator n=1 Tax=Ensifer aridi TaxID=1708715 RepID=UPI000A121888|nr:transcriptional regulator [Ensifer aridi]
MSVARIIVVVAPDRGLRRSLAFALEVEGYFTESYDALWKAEASAKRALCTIVDDEILKSEPQTAKFLERPDLRVVLLVDGMTAFKEHGDTIVLTKPINGSDLVRAVNGLERIALHRDKI